MTGHTANEKEPHSIGVRLFARAQTAQTLPAMQLKITL